MLCRFESGKTPITHHILPVVFGYWLLIIHLVVAGIYAAVVWSTPMTPLLMFYIGSWVLYLRSGEGLLFDWAVQKYYQHDILVNSVPFHQIPIIGAKKKA